MADKNLSGKDWHKNNQAKYPNSYKVAKLDGGFKSNVVAFIKALKDAGAKVKISSTRRDEKRAYVMHYAWTIDKGTDKPGKIPAKAGVDINWDHGDDKKSKKAAKDMVKAFKMVKKAALKSNHISGKAIDMNISWSGVLKIKNKKGTIVEIKKSPTTGANKKLHEVGKSYSVIKLVGDVPHWSHNGH